MSTCSMWPLHCIWDTAALFIECHTRASSLGMYTVSHGSLGQLSESYLLGSWLSPEASSGLQAFDLSLSFTEVNCKKLSAAGWASAHIRILVLVRWDTLSSVCSTF